MNHIVIELFSVTSGGVQYYKGALIAYQNVYISIPEDILEPKTFAYFTCALLEGLSFECFKI